MFIQWVNKVISTAQSAAHIHHFSEFFDYFINFSEAADQILYIFGCLYFIKTDPGQWYLLFFLLQKFQVVFHELDGYGVSYEIKLGFFLKIISLFNEICLNKQISSFTYLWNGCVSSGFSPDSLQAFYNEFGFQKGHEILGFFIFFNNLSSNGGDSISVICSSFEFLLSIDKFNGYDEIREVFNLLYTIWYVLEKFGSDFEFFNNICSMCLYLDKSVIDIEEILDLINRLIEKSSGS